MSRSKVYEAAFEADLSPLRAQHGPGAVADALKLLERQRKQKRPKRRRSDDSVRPLYLESRMPTHVGWISGEWSHRSNQRRAERLLGASGQERQFGAS